MPIYDKNGNVLSSGFGEQIMLKRNNDRCVTEFLTVARSYLGQTDIEYKDGDTIFHKSTETNGIDCSTYVNLCLMGYSYEETPYYTKQYKNPDLWEANPEHIWSIASLRYKNSRYIDGSTPDEPTKLACQLGRWMAERGQVVPMTNGFRDVLPGDIVFWAAKYSSSADWIHPDWYMHISHVGIILTKETAPNTYSYSDGSGRTGTWDKTKYPFKHQIIEVTNGFTTPCTTDRYLERRQEDASYLWDANVNTVCLICRPDLGALHGELT